MARCQECGQELVRNQRKFCGIKCQRAFDRDERTREWLATGVASHIGGLRSHFIRRYIFDAQSGTCAICGSPAHWMGMRRVLVLDHIDGDSTNNARENLRLVCPNCDSQLPTFKSKNRGSGRHFRRERYANGQSYQSTPLGMTVWRRSATDPVYPQADEHGSVRCYFLG